MLVVSAPPVVVSIPLVVVSLINLVPDQDSALPTIFRCDLLSVINCGESLLAVFSSFSGLVTQMWPLRRCIHGL